MLDKEFIKRKLYLNQQELERLRAFENLTIDEIAKDPMKHAACERFLERLIGRAIDINQHIIGEKGNVTLTVLKYRDTFLCLADMGVYPKEFAERIAPSAGPRNALVRDYNNVDQELLQKSIGEAIQEFNEYGKYILEYVEREKNGFSTLGLIIIIIIIAAALVVGGGFFAYQYQKIPRIKDYTTGVKQESSSPTPPSQQPSAAPIDTSIWKTYRDEKYGFEVKYPPTYSFLTFPLYIVLTDRAAETEVFEIIDDTKRCYMGPLREVGLGKSSEETKKVHFAGGIAELSYYTPSHPNEKGLVLPRFILPDGSRIKRDDRIALLEYSLSLVTTSNGLIQNRKHYDPTVSGIIPDKCIRDYETIISSLLFTR